MQENGLGLMPMTPFRQPVSGARATYIPQLAGPLEILCAETGFLPKAAVGERFAKLATAYMLRLATAVSIKSCRSTSGLGQTNA